MTGAQIPEPSGIGSRELLLRRLRLTDQNTSQWSVLRRNLSVVYPGLQEKTDQLTYARNSETRPGVQPAKTNTIERNKRIGILSERIPNTERNFVYCAIWRTMILIEPFIRLLASWLADFLVGDAPECRVHWIIIFPHHGAKERVRKQPSYMRSPSYFADSSNSVFLLFQGTCRGFSPTFWAREAIKLRN